MLSWELDDLEHPTAAIVRFESHEHAEHESLWRLFQSIGLGVSALPSVSCDSAISTIAPCDSRPPASDKSTSTTRAAATGTDRSSIAGASARSTAVRMRVLSLPEAFYALVATRWLAIPETLGSLHNIWERLSCATTTASAEPRQRRHQQQEQFDISDFQVHFVAQFHLRELGWTLRSGLNYGGHYVLYRGAASAFHSEYIAYVKGADAPLSWGALQALTRVAADVKKTVLVCDVAREGRNVVNAGTNNGVVLSGNDVAAERPLKLSHDGSNNSKSLTEGEYEFFGRRFRFSAVAIRFWDVAGADAQPAPGGEQSWSFAFQPQPTLSKKLKKMPQLRAKRNLTSKIVKQGKHDPNRPDWSSGHCRDGPEA